MARKSVRRSKLRLSGWLPKSRWIRWLLAAAAAGFIVFGVIGWRLSRRVEEFLADRGPGPIRVYADSTVLRKGLNVEGAHLVGRFRRLGYRETDEDPKEPGEFRASRQRIEAA